MIEWKDVVGYEDYFRVSNTGSIFSKRTNKYLKLIVSKTGYHIFTTKFNGRKSKSYCFKVHRLVAEAFISNPENKPVVNHKDGNKINNKIINLEWATHSENSQHAIDTKLQIPTKGEARYNAILTDEDVRNIKKLYIPKIFGKRKIAKVLGLKVGLVDGVLHSNGWGHVKE